ncbi:hypothetical protein GCM10007940_14320 [Portibacter lacus]|uniref:Uncharacterized protein n=1 Tax=Portibacter lacus TaxID=1099794 RepID=A0AA37SN88_9BACT|nr:hypothetical protein GCM10007940_14320 [Portibacter lacus]
MISIRKDESTDNNNAAQYADENDVFFPESSRLIDERFYIKVEHGADKNTGR